MRSVPPVVLRESSAMVARVVAFCVLIAAWPAQSESFGCHVRARTEAGWVCGLERWAEHGAIYASFRGVPYGKQPLGDLRFRELQPVEPWGEQLFDATEDGPVCYQSDVIYGGLATPQGMSEACIHANVHVPIDALPDYTQSVQVDLHAPFTGGLPILVFIHGGGFMSGSGDSDLHGAEYLVSKNVIVITFNYRLNVFGFLSLNSSEIPGNQGLRDQVTLLRWVQRNARAFGGDPDNVTLMGQSAGATSAHLLTLSEATKGLFKRAYLMSGTAISSFYSPSPVLAAMLSESLLALLGINSTDAADVHRQLVQMPVLKIHEAHKVLLDQFGLVTFAPTVEAAYPGVTRVLDDYPEALMKRGRGGDVPLIVGFTNAECEAFRPRLDQINIAERVTKNPILNVPVQVLFTTPPERTPRISEKILRHYYKGPVTTQGFIKFCTEAYYKYPVLRLVPERAGRASAPLYLYQFSYESTESPLHAALNSAYRGAAHIEDLTYVFRTNSVLGLHNSLPPVHRDDHMKDWMTNFVVDFMHCSNPVCHNVSAWPATTLHRLTFQDIEQPTFRTRDLLDRFRDILTFFDNLDN